MASEQDTAPPRTDELLGNARTAATPVVASYDALERAQNSSPFRDSGEPMAAEELETGSGRNAPKSSKVTWWTNRERKKKPDGEPGALIAARPQPLKSKRTPFAPFLDAEVLSTTARITGVSYTDTVSSAQTPQHGATDSIVQSTAEAFTVADLLDALLAAEAEDGGSHEPEHSIVPADLLPGPCATSVAPASATTTISDSGSAQVKMLLDAADALQAAQQQRVIRQLPRRALGRSVASEALVYAADTSEDSDDAGSETEAASVDTQASQSERVNREMPKRCRSGAF